MNWLTNFVRPKIRSLVRPREVPDNLWDKCPQCERMIFHRDLAKTLSVCPHCDYHMRLPAKARLDMLFDQAAYQRIELPRSAVDPLRFRDVKRYADRLKDLRVLEDALDGAALLLAGGERLHVVEERVYPLR